MLLLVYHFKNRMSVAEKKSETMYGLLSSVVREIKSLRSMFLPAAPQKDASLEKDEQLKVITKKSEPEVQVSVGPESEVITVNLVSPHAENIKIVVSDDEEDDDDDEEGEVSDEDEESESESEKESGNDSESDSESEAESEAGEDLRVEDLGSEIILDSVVPENAPEEPITVDLSFSPEELENRETNQNEERVEQVSEFSGEPATEVAPVSQKNLHSIDQLKKMNINQLKTIAIQSGITVDTSKLKKHDLITLIVDA